MYVVRYSGYVQGFEPEYVGERPWRKDPVARQLIIGSLLGKARIVRKGRTFVLREERGSRIKDYLRWKTSILKIGYSERGRSVLIWSRNHPYLLELHTYHFDASGNIKTTSGLLDAVDDIGLLVWYIDRGSYEVRSQTCRLGLRNTDSPTKKMVTEWFRTKWGIEPTPTKSGLRFGVKETEKLLTLLYPMFRQYALPQCVVEKMGHFAKENRPKIEAVNARYRINKNTTVHIPYKTYNDILVECRKNAGETFGLVYGTILPRKVIGYVVVPFPSDKSHIYFDAKVIKRTRLPNRKYIGWFHSHLKDFPAPSDEDITTHLSLFPELKYVMLIVNLNTSEIKAFDHIKSDGDLRECRLID